MIVLLFHASFEFPFEVDKRVSNVLVSFLSVYLQRFLVFTGE